MRIALIAFLILQDACGILCFTEMLRLLWQFPERSRRGTAVVCAAAGALSIAAAVLCTLQIPQSVYAGEADDLSQAYTTYLICVNLQSLVSAALLLSVPQILLRSRRHFHVFLVELSVYMLAESLFGVVSTVLRLDEGGPAKLLAEAACCTAVFLMMYFFFRTGNKKENPLPIRNVIDTFPRWIYPLFMLFAFTIYSKTGLFDGGMDTESAQRVFDALWVASSLGVVICGIYFFYRIFLLSYRQTQILKQMNDQQTQYEQALKSDEQLRAFRHDYKNHMMVVTALLNSGRTDEAADYLEKIRVAAGSAGKMFSTGNFVADAILNNKNSLAEEYAVHLSFEGRIPDAGIENSDLCAVFANLLDNAVEGASRFNGNRWVQTEATVRNGYLSLSFENPVNAPVKIKNDRIKTSKGDAKTHGYGLRNVKNTVEKYHGKLALSCDEQIFRAEVMMKLDHTMKGDPV